MLAGQCYQRGEVSAGGAAHERDPVRIDLQLGSLAPEQLHRGAHGAKQVQTALTSGLPAGDLSLVSLLLDDAVLAVPLQILRADVAERAQYGIRMFA